MEPVHLGGGDVGEHGESRWEADKVHEDTVRGPDLTLIIALKIFKKHCGEYDQKVWQNTKLVDVDGLKVVPVFDEELDNDKDVETDQDKTDKRKWQKSEVFIWAWLAL